MNYKKITMWIVLATVAILIVYDFVAVFQGGTEASISHLMITLGKEFPLVTLSMGILMGHFFFGIRPTKEYYEKLSFEEYSCVKKWVSEIDEKRKDASDNFK